MLKLSGKDSILLIGTGPMAIEYGKVLKSMKKDIVAVGRSQDSTKMFENETGIKAATGGIENWLTGQKKYPQKAFVVVSENELGNVALSLIKRGIKNILMEKPGGFSVRQIRQVRSVAQKNKAKVYLGYNRRFYSSVLAGEKIIKADGGVTSFNFEFTEWGHIIAPLKKAPGIKKNWFLHNSTHVIDLAFFLGGTPSKISTYTSGSLPWHPRASKFVGAGETKNGALFSYQANWLAPGRWGVEILTSKHRLIYRPLEKLQIQKIGSVAIEEVPIDDKLDVEYKPGLYRQVESFVFGRTGRLCAIAEQVENLAFYQKIGGIK